MSDYYFKRAYNINVQHHAHKETEAKYKTYGYDRAFTAANRIHKEFTDYVV